MKYSSRSASPRVPRAEHPVRFVPRVREVLGTRPSRTGSLGWRKTIGVWDSAVAFCAAAMDWSSKATIRSTPPAWTNTSACVSAADWSRFFSGMSSMSSPAKVAALPLLLHARGDVGVRQVPSNSSSSLVASPPRDEGTWSSPTCMRPTRRTSWSAEPPPSEPEQAPSRAASKAAPQSASALRACVRFVIDLCLLAIGRGPVPPPTLRAPGSATSRPAWVCTGCRHAGGRPAPGRPRSRSPGRSLR